MRTTSYSPPKPSPALPVPYSGGIVQHRLTGINTPNEFWFEGNSYVMVESADGHWLTTAERRVDLLSINGGGEVRWSITPWHRCPSLKDVAPVDYFDVIRADQSYKPRYVCLYRADHHYIRPLTERETWEFCRECTNMGYRTPMVNERYITTCKHEHRMRLDHGLFQYDTRRVMPWDSKEQYCGACAVANNCYSDPGPQREVRDAMAAHNL